MKWIIPFIVRPNDMEKSYPRSKRIAEFRNRCGTYSLSAVELEMKVTSNSTCTGHEGMQGQSRYTGTHFMLGSELSPSSRLCFTPREGTLAGSYGRSATCSEDINLSLGGTETWIVQFVASSF